MKYFNTFRAMLWLLVLLANRNTFAQNSMVGDGFGGRAGYLPVNYIAGYDAGFAVCGTNKQLYVWGTNTSTYFGASTPITSTSPITLTGMTNVRLFRAAGFYATAIKDDGTGWIWGARSTVASMVTPTKAIDNAYFAYAGINHSSFVKTDGTVWSVGRNDFGAYGDGTLTSSCLYTTCTAVQMQGITTAKRVACGAYHTAILLANGTVMQVGGKGSSSTVMPTSLNSLTPVTVPGLNSIIDIKAGDDNFYALTSSGQVYSWGYSFFGTMGTGASGTVTTYMPTLVTFPSGAGAIKAISAQRQNCMALDDNGNVYAWGANAQGSIGLGTSSNVSFPQLVTTGVSDISTGGSFSYIYKTNGTFWGTGAAFNEWMNISNTQRGTFTQVNPTIAPMNLCAPTPFNGMPPCVAGTTPPSVTPTTATNTCPATTVNLGSLAISSTTPSGASLIWSTHKVPTSAADTLTMAQANAVSTAGMYYALYYDATNVCYSPADSVVVTMTTCAPVTISNTCPTATVNLTTAITPNNVPSGATVTWHTGTPATTANKVADPTAINTSGTYYFAYYDGNANCYSDASEPIIVTITTCIPPVTANNPPTQTATTGENKTGNAATELAPTGGLAPYIYTNGLGDAACIALSGATALSAASNLTVNSSTGAYSYTAPATAGNYYFCIKVCDSTTPTAQCVMKTYTITVTAPPTCTISNIMPTFIKN